MASKKVARVTRSWLACVFVVGLGVGCKGSDAPATGATPVAIPGIPGLPGTPTAPAGGAAAPAPAGGAMIAAGSGLARLRDQAPLATTMTIEFLDRQLYHPASRNRVILDIRDTSKTKRFTGADYGVSLLMSARNDSNYLLNTPRVLSDVMIHGANGAQKCRAEVNRYGLPVVTVASEHPDARNAWGDESRSLNESPWRPGETIRVGVNLFCGSVRLQDIGIQNMTGSVRLAADALFGPSEEPCPYPGTYTCANDVVGTSPAIELPARAFTAQQVQIPGGLSGYSAGDLFIRAVDGRVIHESLGIHMASVFSATGSDLPATGQFGADTLDEFTMTVTGASIRHANEVPGTLKGFKVVTVTANLAINGGAIQGRLAALSDPETAAGQVEGERGRLAGLLGCDAIELVTQTRQVRSSNGRDVKPQCQTLETQDAVQVAWTFTVDRYEIPLGISYQIDRVPHTMFFANATLATIDPH